MHKQTLLCQVMRTYVCDILTTKAEIRGLEKMQSIALAKCTFQTLLYLVAVAVKAGLHLNWSQPWRDF